MQVPCLEERLSTYASSFEAAQQLEEASAVLAVHVDAQAELRASECLAAVLARTLALGNFLNWGSRLGQAPGFRLKNLPKLQVYACSGCERTCPGMTCISQQAVLTRRIRPLSPLQSQL